MKQERTNKSKIAVCVLAFALAYVFAVLASALKIFVLDSWRYLENANPTSAFWFTAVILALAVSGYATYIFTARGALIKKPKSLFVILTTITFTFVVNVVLCAVNYYYMFLSLTAFVLSSLSEKKDVFIANMMTNLLTFIALFFNAGLTNADVGTVETLALMVVLDIAMGAFVSALLSGSYHRTMFIVWGLLLESVVLGLMFALSFVINPIVFNADIVLTVLCTYAPVILALLLQPVFESMFSILSNPKLHELTDHSSPLIKRLISEAPGTFNHCLSVASYAEVCAIAIGENPHLAKACAYYHDIGKMENPKYFSENQGDTNLHDGLLPEVSAEIVRKHTTDGYELCEKYRIPAEIRDVTVQHHGTLPMAVFYHKAKNLTDSDVDIDDYSYHGVTPEGKIAAILMICDAAEAAIRAMGKPSAEEVDKLIGNIIADRIAKKQFDNCDITQKDLNVIKNTIIDVYGGHVHKRVKYPSGK